MKHKLELDQILKLRVNTLSGGMKKRLSIGCALANRPSLLILDEPTASLDLPCKAEIRAYLKLYLNQGGSIIITTHDEPDLELCNRILLLKNGFLTEIPNDFRAEQLESQLRH